MSQKIVYYCDCCPKGIETQVEMDSCFFINHGSKMDAAGSMESDVQTVWVCYKCSIGILKRLSGEVRSDKLIESLKKRKVDEGTR